MKLPLQIAKKIAQLLLPNTSLPSSLMKHAVVNKMLEDGMLQKQQIGNSKASIVISAKENVQSYLHNHFGITNLDDYILLLEQTEMSRAEAIAVSGNSKLKSIRTFKGFLVNCYKPVEAWLGERKITINPTEGIFTFISDYEHFSIGENVTVVGVENAENFRQIAKQQYLFESIETLFVSRYPQSNDLIKWLQTIPNKYIHFGDVDFAGIDIYLSAFKKHLINKSQFFVPPNTESLLKKFGNKNLYNKQYSSNRQYNESEEEGIKTLVRLFLKYKMVLEQEIFILP
jgi:hypothetical protein